jgi:hypothetical protein
MFYPGSDSLTTRIAQTIDGGSTVKGSREPEGMDPSGMTKKRNWRSRAIIKPARSKRLRGKGIGRKKPRDDL